ncbi:hypothetical protein TM49_22355 [Martelella endophytica]|uniref:Membrane-binding protein n=2 Tax=Martelella endophytica TaxID=1486262 RepID=A0A0D5LU82_MAREN|nr:hypothetical protein TM49_22355 [Martelella endophytica]
MLTFDEAGNIAARTPYKDGEKDGTEVWYWADGKTRREITWKDGVLNGPWRSYYQDGKLEAENDHVDGRIDGVERKYHENGKLAAEVHWALSKRDGPYRDYDKDGNLIEEGHYVDGAADGDVTEYWPSGERRALRHYVMGKPTGSAKRWSRSGELVAQTDYAEDGGELRNRKWKDGELIWLEEPVAIEGRGEGRKTVERYGNFTETEIKAEGYLLFTRTLNDELIDRHELVDGKYRGLFVSTTDLDKITTRVHYVDGKEDGLFTRVWRGRELERGYYDHGKRVGDWRRVEHSTDVVHETYDADGKLTGEQHTFALNGKLKTLATYDHGTLDGPYKELDGEQVIAGGNYVDGQKHGDWLEQAPYRDETRQGRYAHGVKEGRWTTFDGNGYRTEITSFSHDRKDGPSYILAENGAVEEVQMWKHDKRDGYTTYYDDEGPVSHQLWRDGWLEGDAFPAGDTR